MYDLTLCRNDSCYYHHHCEVVYVCMHENAVLLASIAPSPLLIRKVLLLRFSTFTTGQITLNRRQACSVRLLLRVTALSVFGAAVPPSCIR